MAIRIYVRRSKNDPDKQLFSLDVQCDGARTLASDAFPDESIDVYVDDGKAGDEFLNRPGLQRILRDCQPGDIIIARDQSRLGRDALEVSLVIRELVQDRKCRLLYYATRQEVAFSNAIEQATTYIQGVGHQLELEAIRSRTTEALRSRVRAGRIAGGRCYGYRLVRKVDESGRPFTTAEVEEKHAEVIRRIFSTYAHGRSLKDIAKSLNDAGVPSPTVGRRGNGAWAPTGLRSMLLNPRYRGLYIHGRIKQVRRRGTLVRVKADPTEVITIQMPEWRIVSDEMWIAVERTFARRRRSEPKERRNAPIPGPACKYMLSGIGRCATCGNAIVAVTLNNKWPVVRTYGCGGYQRAGRFGCTVAMRQAVAIVDAALVGHVARFLDVRGVREQIASEVGALLKTMSDQEGDIRNLRKRLAGARKAVKRLTRLGTLAGDDAMSAMASELKARAADVRRLKTALESARKAPSEIDIVRARLQARVARQLALANPQLTHVAPAAKRMLFEALFEEGLIFEPGLPGSRSWRIRSSVQVR